MVKTALLLAIGTAAGVYFGPCIANADDWRGAFRCSTDKACGQVKTISSDSIPWREPFDQNQWSKQ